MNKSKFLILLIILTLFLTVAVQSRSNDLNRNESEKKIKSLIYQLNNDNPALRGKVINSLVRFGANAVGPLIAELKSENVLVRRGIITALGDIGGGQVVPPLIEALNDKNDYVRADAVYSLGKTRDIGIIKPLIQMLADESMMVRGLAQNTLGDIGEIGVDSLIEAMKDKNVLIKGGAISPFALGKIRSVKAIAPLIEMLKDDNLKVCVIAREALIKHGSLATEPLIKAVKKENDPLMKRIEIEILGTIKDPKATDLLITIMNSDKNESTRVIAMKSLAMISEEKRSSGKKKETPKTKKGQEVLRSEGIAFQVGYSLTNALLTGRERDDLINLLSAAGAKQKEIDDIMSKFNLYDESTGGKRFLIQAEIHEEVKKILSADKNPRQDKFLQLGSLLMTLCHQSKILDLEINEIVKANARKMLPISIKISKELGKELLNNELALSRIEALEQLNMKNPIDHREMCETVLKIRKEFISSKGGDGL